MEKAKAALVYGLTIRSAELVFAADAWTRLRPTCAFFDLVFLRRRKGGFASSNRLGTQPVTRIPDEVWELVRYWLVQDEIADSEDTLLGSFACDEDVCESRPPVPQRASWEHFRDCVGSCSDYSGDWIYDNVCRWTKSRTAMMTGLLADYGLALPSHAPILTDHEYWPEPEAMALIALRTNIQKTPLEEGFVEASSGSDGSHQSTLVDVSLDLPRDADTRFINFIRLFRLQVVESSVRTIRAKSNPRYTRGGAKPTTLANSGVKNRPASKIVPG
ncbi:hypothetical protein JCM11491_004464 [Sporobolomyces phaffii]